MGRRVEEKIETSIPVQGRISLVSLAELDTYFERAGYRIRTMSQLLSWSVELLCSTLKTNKVDIEHFDSIVEANRYLETKGLYQPSMRDRGFKKLGNALRFESLREEGTDPRNDVPHQYNIVHNSHSVEPLPQELEPWQKERLEKQRLAHLEWKERQMNIAKSSGLMALGTEATNTDDKIVTVREGMSEDEFNQRNLERERDIQEKENAPLDLDFLKSQIVKDK